MTWKEFLAKLRADLQDTGPQPRWNNALLLSYTQDAVLDYSIYFPRRIDRVALEEKEGSYTLPADFVEEITVECPRDTYLERRQERPGVKLLNQRFCYFIEGGQLYAPLGQEVLLTYFAVHEVPTGTEEFTIPDRDIELPRLYVQAKIHGQMRSKQSRLDRFETGRRDDNPLTPETRNLMDEYYNKVADRITGGAVRLYRPGRPR